MGKKGKMVTKACGLRARVWEKGTICKNCFPGGKENTEGGGSDRLSHLETSRKSNNVL